MHEVKPGQSLWLIAIAYETRIDDIKSLNSLFDNSLFPGQRLLIKPGVIVTALPATATLAQPDLATMTSLPTWTVTTLAPTGSPTPPAITDAPASNTGVIQIAIGIIALAVLGGGIFTWLGSRKRGNTH